MNINHHLPDSKEESSRSEALQALQGPDKKEEMLVGSLGLSLDLNSATYEQCVLSYFPTFYTPLSVN